MRSAISALAAIIVICGIAGCGGGGASNSNLAGRATGIAVFTIHWPERSRLIPEASNSIKVAVNNGTAQVAQQLLPRPTGLTSTATFDTLPVGTLSLTATAFPHADGSGVAQASATAPLVIQANKATAFSLTMNSTIARFDVAPLNPSVSAGRTVSLQATAKDAAGNVVLTTPSKILWTSGNTALATVDMSGKVTGVKVGTADITVKDQESGIKTTVHVQVTAAIDLLVTGGQSDRINRYNGMTGAFKSIFVTGAQLDGPSGTALGPDKNLYVGSFFNNQIQRYNGKTGAFIDVFATGGGLNGPEQIRFGPDGNLYVVSRYTGQILRYNGTTGAFMDVFASGGLDEPFDMQFGPDGNLYVSSRNTNNVVRYNGTTGASMGVFASGGGLTQALGVSFGPDGNFYVVSRNTQQVLRFNGATGKFLKVFASGSGITDPTGLVFGPDGNMYISDNMTNDIKRFNGTTGAFIDVFVTSGSGGLILANYPLFVPLP